jgi:hypothetical protein
MNLSQTLKYRDMKAAVAGTQATHADSRSTDDWVKSWLDRKNERLNNLRKELHALLDFPQPIPEDERGPLR